MSPAKWTIQQPNCFVFRHWGDESVVYDTRNGDTHWLDPLTRVALEILAESAKDVPELALSISCKVVIPPEVDLLALTESTVQQLRRIGLTKPDTA